MPVRHHGDGIRALHLLESLADRIGQALGPSHHGFVDKVGNDFGVGLRLEFAAGGLEAIAQDGVILHDTVVDDGNRSGPVGMRVLAGRSAVGGPAGVTNAESAPGWVFSEKFFERRQLALAAYDLRMLSD